VRGVLEDGREDKKFVGMLNSDRFPYFGVRDATGVETFRSYVFFLLLNENLHIIIIVTSVEASFVPTPKHLLVIPSITLMVHRTRNRSIFETVNNRSVNHFTTLTSFNFF
jgi:hypothetical protein